jgi:tetratricopeptide (TPR) repeat protein
MCRSNAPSQSAAAPRCYTYNNTNHTDESGLPSEAQLTLLCLDYLRSLRRSYQNKQDLLNGAGLHADHISLAIWSLSRAFACPELTFGAPKMSTVVEEGEEVKVVGGGGVAGSEDECVGNDSFHRLLNDVSSNDSDDNIAAIPRAMFALTDSIKLPSMKDITNEILLSYSDKARGEECLQYEYYDMHSSNSHRFYLLNGMAGEAIDGEPLTLCDLAAVALSTLNAKSRIEADKEVERDPLFKDFIAAAEKNGFFNEKKLNSDGEIRQSVEEEALRQRVLYQSKYRKVLAKFRSKLAVKEEQEVSNGPLWALKAFANAHSASIRLQTRRDRMIEQVKKLRVEEEECNVEKASHEDLIGDIARLEKKKSKMQLLETEALCAVIAEKDAALADANDSIDNLKNDLNELLDNRSALESKLEVLNNEQAKSQSRIKELIASTDHMEEFYKSQVSTVKEELENTKATVLISNQSKEVEELKKNVENARELATKSQNAEKELKCMLNEELKASEALKEEMENCEDLKASIDFLTESNAALTKTVDDLLLERSGADANVKTLKKDLKKALKVIAKLESNEKKLIEQLASAEVPVSPAVQTPPAKTRKNADKAAWVAPLSPKSVSTFTSSLVSTPEENLLFHQGAEGINTQGNELMQKKQFSEALEQFTSALILSPNGPNSHIYYANRAAAYCHLGQYADAAEDCLKSIELNDTYEEAYSRCSMCLLHLGDVQASVAAQKMAFDLARNAYCSDLNTIEEGSC